LSNVLNLPNTGAERDERKCWGLPLYARIRPIAAEKMPIPFRSLGWQDSDAKARRQLRGISAGIKEKAPDASVAENLPRASRNSLLT
jgi:hypothetical protein